MTRDEFQILAGERIADALALLNAGRWSGAYYLGGYAVECALKACVAKLTREHDFPDKNLAVEAFTHNNETLMRVARLKAQLDLHQAANPRFAKNWLVVKDWNEAARYAVWTEIEARKLLLAVSDTTDGVLTWVMTHW